MSSISSFICSFCQVEKFILNKYLTHLQICHEAEANFTVACGLNGCPCAYNTIKGLRQHMRIKHNQIYYADRNKTNVDESLHSSVNEGLELLNCDFDNELASSTLNQPLNRDINDFVFKLQKHFAMFVIGLGQKHSIPTIVQLEIGNEVHALINYFSSNYGDCLKNYLSKAGFILDSHHDLVELFKSEALLDKAFSVVSSEAKIMTYCKANLGFVAPLQIEIQADYDKQIINDIKNDKRNSLTNIAQIIAKISSQVKTNTSQTINSTRYLNNQKKFFQYIPILEVIKKFVQHKDVWASIHRANQNKNQSSDLLCSYRDGNIFHKHVVFCKNKHALRIHMYIDEFEVCNPIGSHRSTHKLCAFYFFIGNLEYKYHSQLKYIHLCLLIKEKYIKQSNTYAELLKPLISDLNELCLNGIALTIDGESLQLYGALATISADNLSYLQLLVESFVQTFVELYPGKLTPKLHFLLHYPRLIADYGPLRYLWCMRFEAKHQYFKKLAGAVRNFKNIAYILAKRHQLHQCWEFEASSFLKEITESSGECSIYFNNIPECHRSKIICFFEVSNFSDSEVLWKCNKLTIDSVKYKIYDVVLVGSLHGEDIPLFFKIMYIYKLKESWFFIGKVLICEQFSVHLHAYSVKEDIELSVCQPCNIIDPQLLNSYILADGKIC
nr:uncharacterized protein LOC105845782 isoform X3 [Hydra vulgaris]